ncbi:general stress protein CsbD [Draconibacterium halophilum]|uniref:General stress protein CsbD n=1 Tax=Draconibacterium halophilum TaxID=2706887 RepID=A0A6C0RBX4_9BACT|nr:general stress protein CsbD [Draconibacterium halophilum]QIA07402.1 general stress protein CsbD [Draconibacterium halophilum]
MRTNNSIENNWSVIKLGLKEKYPQLSKEDLTYIDGYENEFLHNLELKLGMNREQLTTILHSLIPIERTEKA